MTLVNSSFDGRAYGGWRRSILIALSAKNKLGFIDGTCKSPPSDSPDFNLWNMSNDMVTSWLLNSLSREIAASVLYSKSAQELWTALEDRFGQSNGAKLYHITFWDWKFFENHMASLSLNTSPSSFFGCSPCC